MPTPPQSYREMKAAGWELGVRSYRGAIISAAKAGACDAALDLLGEMQASRVELTEASPGIYNTVAIACAKASSRGGVRTRQICRMIHTTYEHDDACYIDML